MDGSSPKKPANFFRYLVVQTKLLFFLCLSLRRGSQGTIGFLRVGHIVRI